MGCSCSVLAMGMIFNRNGWVGHGLGSARSGIFWTRLAWAMAGLRLGCPYHGVGWAWACLIEVRHGPCVAWSWTSVGLSLPDLVKPGQGWAGLGLARPGLVEAGQVLCLVWPGAHLASSCGSQGLGWPERRSGIVQIMASPWVAQPMASKPHPLPA
jgi:hypothetical protein